MNKNDLKQNNQKYFGFRKTKIMQNFEYEKNLNKIPNINKVENSNQDISENKNFIAFSNLELNKLKNKRKKIDNINNENNQKNKIINLKEEKMIIESN